MPAYAIAHLREVAFGDEIATYIARIDETLAPFGGRFLIHGATPEVLEGHWEGDLVMIAFPDADAARRWYRSDAYQAIRPLRTRNAQGCALIIEGVPEGYAAAELLAKLG